MSESGSEEFFTKHYIPPKKNAGMKVNFNENVNVKPATVVNTIQISTLQRDEDEIINCVTLEGIEKIKGKLLKELENIEENKKKGYDIYEKYEDLQYKFQLAKEAKIRIENELKKKKQYKEIKEIEVSATTETYDDKSVKLQRDLIFDYLHNQNSYQILLVFYNCVSLHEKNISYFLNEIFNKFQSLDLKISVSILDQQSLRSSDFVDINSLSKLDNVLFKENVMNLRIFQNKIHTFEWIKNSPMIKIVSYITSSKSNKKEIENMIKWTRLNKLNLRQLYFDSFLVASRENAGTKTVSLSELCKIELFQNMFIEAKQRWEINELCALKRLDLKSVEDFKNYQKSLVNLEINLNKGSYKAVLRTFEKSNYLQDISIENLNIQSNETIRITDKISKQHKCIRKKEASCDDSNGSYFIENLHTNVSSLNFLDVNFTAAFLAEEFNEVTRFWQKVRVAPAFLMSTDDSQLLIAQKMNTKYNDIIINNSSCANKLLQAFMHFTYDFTEQKLIVTDGATYKRKRKGLLLTDPVIFSTDADRFGLSNLGQKGIKMLMDNHNCNTICSRLELSGSRPYKNCCFC